MTIELSNLSPEQLEELIKSAKKQKRIAEKNASRAPASEVKAKLIALAKENGYTVDELFGPKTPRATKGSKVAPKFRNPATGDEWTGRGKQPKWLVAELAKGRALSDFNI